MKSLTSFVSLLALPVFAAEWISVPDAPIATEADKKADISAPGTSWFCRDVTRTASKNYPSGTYHIEK